ncbi:hypothetical protein LIS77_06500 [Cytobacillus firmus]|uniref:hypothetical protein n=1 Tax=Cytobacillus firmus TaxID=1399 RepID=UPI00207AA57F|nr:hypothetical protein [Cytobacillus firmus]USK40147.1 hypothetical protein LIS77_06500 [Cytobacillus firmus]
MSEGREKYIEMGLQAKSLAELHKQYPKQFTAENVLTSLLEVYEEIGFKALNKKKKAASSPQLTAK